MCYLKGISSGHGGMGSPFDGRCRRFIIYMCPARRSYVVPGLCAISKASPRIMVGWVAPSMVAADGTLSCLGG